MKASVMPAPTAVHVQLQKQLFHMSPPTLAAVGTAAYGGGIPMASLFQEMEMPVVLSDDPSSDLTCHLSGSRKRGRDEAFPVPAIPATTTIMYGNHLQQHALLQKHMMLQDVLSVKSSRANQSAMTTSTSGRPNLLASQTSVASHANHTPNTYTSTSSTSNLMSLFHHQNLEVETLLHLHAERLQSGLEEAQKRHCRAVVSALEQYAQNHVAQKQAELEAATKRNAVLEDRIRQSVTEVQTLFISAKNSEALVATLRDSLQQALLQTNNGGNCGTSGQDLSCFHPAGEEGYGDNEEEGISASPAAASGALFLSVPCVKASSSLVGATGNKPDTGTGTSFLCRRCGESDATVLVLPCRHLCLCPYCDRYIQECPVCSRRKNASLEINLS